MQRNEALGNKVGREKEELKKEKWEEVMGHYQWERRILIGEIWPGKDREPNPLPF